MIKNYRKLKKMVKTINFVTSNKGKYLEAKKILPQLRWLNLSLMEIQSLSPTEILRWKVFTLRPVIDGPFVVEDTSLFLECFNFKAPGPFIKIFLQTFSLHELFKFAAAKGKLRAKAVTIVAYSKDSRFVRFFRGETLGELCKPVVQSRFGWDPIFRPAGHNKVFAQMKVAEKNRFSMRGKAFLKLATYLKSNGEI